MRDSTSWIIAGPKTFRLASKQILPKRQEHNGKIKRIGFGGNLQNLEKSAREVYIADEGKMFAQTDQGGAEALVVAYLCEAGAFRQLFIHGVKPHVYVALHVFKDIWQRKMAGVEGFDIDKIIKTPIQALKSNPFWKDLDALIKDSDNWSLDQRYYYLAKQTCHSANYGIEAPTFRMNILEKSGGKINISKDDGERFLLTYHSLFPEIQDWHRRLKRQAEQTKMLYNLFGHPYSITSYQILESHWKELFSWIPQSTVGMITNIAFYRLQKFVEDNRLDWDNLINGHDSILSQAPINEIMDLGRKQKEFIEQEFTSPVDGAVFRMRSETQAGFNWSNFKQDKNPLGLKEIKL